MTLKEKRKSLSTTKWLKFRERILKEHNYLCVESKRFGKSVQAEMVHHIYPVSEYPELEFVKWNCIPLTNKVHNTFHDRSSNKIINGGLVWQRKRKKEFEEFYQNRKRKKEKQKNKIIIVWGSPGSGKTTYVEQHMQAGDLVIDLDNILQAMTNEYKQEVSQEILDMAFEIRELMLRQITKRQFGDCNVYVVGCLPQEYQRIELLERLKADDVIEIKTSYEQCLKNAMNDEKRKDKKLQKEIIQEFWSKKN